VRVSAQRVAHLLARLESLLDRERRGWLRSMIHRQQSQLWKEILCGTPPEPLSRRVARFRRGVDFDSLRTMELRLTRRRVSFARRGHGNPWEKPPLQIQYPEIPLSD